MAVRFYDEMLNWHDGDRSPHAAEPAPAALVQQGEVRSHYGRFAEWLGAQSATNRDYWGTPGGQKLIEMLPRRRVGEPKDLDGLLLLLASDEARFINGAIIAADDGLAVM